MSIETKKERKAWSLVKRAQSFTHAFRGLRICIATTPNLLIHFVATVIVIVAGFYFKVSETEWIILILAIGFVIVTEVLNTAFEIDINLTSPEYHPFARDTKDVAAAAVLLSVLFAIIIGIVVFLPKVVLLFN